MNLYFFIYLGKIKEKQGHCCWICLSQHVSHAKLKSGWKHALINWFQTLPYAAAVFVGWLIFINACFHTCYFSLSDAFIGTRSENKSSFLHFTRTIHRSRTKWLTASKTLKSDTTWLEMDCTYRALAQRRIPVESSPRPSSYGHDQRCYQYYKPLMYQITFSSFLSGKSMRIRIPSPYRTRLFP